METEQEYQSHSKLVNQLIIIITATVLAAASTIYNNSLRSSPIFLFLLTFGIGAALWLGLKRGGLVGMILLSVWVTTKQFIGSWSEDRLFLNLIEITTSACAFYFCGIYGDKLRSLYNEYLDNKQRLKLLDIENPTVGLIRATVGLLRLREETERAIRYHQPLSFVLILIRFNEIPQDKREQLAVMRAVATTIKATTRTMDIPFQVNQEKIGLILPDTEINGANKVINNISRKMISTFVITSNGSSAPLQQYAQVRFGLGTFVGYGNETIDLMEAAESSIQKNIAANPGNIFQNLFIDWEVVGKPAHLAETFIQAENLNRETAIQNDDSHPDPIIDNRPRD